MHRRGELSAAAIDRGWPYQVALEQHFTAKNHDAIEQARHQLGACPRGHFVRRNDLGYVVYCFADPINAEIFMAKFKGERFDPKDRGRGSRWWEWRQYRQSRPKPSSAYRRG